MTAPEEILHQNEKIAFHNANEAETRIHVIDQILFSILEWTHDDINVEVRVSEDGKAQFSDYKVSTGMTAFVVEAKRVGTTFHDVPNTRRAKLRGPLMDGASGDAIRQARDYARRLSIPFAVVTNGAQWIVFPATRTDEVRFEDSSAVIFPSLRAALQEDYSEFYDLLSRQAVISGSLENELLGRIEDQVEERRLNRFYSKGVSRSQRNPFFGLIEDAVVTAFTDDIIAGDADLLEKCYVATPDRLRFDKRIRMHISKRQQVTTVRPKRPLKRRDQRALIETIESAASRARPVAVLLLGPVGAGKTTFLNYTRKVAAANLFEPRNNEPYPHWVFVDFRELSSGESPVDFIFSRCRSYIDADEFLSDYERCIQYAYRDQLAALFRGPLHLLADDEIEKKRRVADLLAADYEKVTPYVEQILGYAAKNTPVFLVIDNVDQHESSDVQGRIFNDSMAIARRLGLNLILSLRDSTFVKHRNFPIFDAFDFDPISIDAPGVRAVLSRRFFLASNLLKGRQGEFIAENGAKVFLDDLSIGINLVQDSVLGTEVGNLLEVLATGDIRLALRMTREFLQYGYSAPGKAIRIHQETGKYVLPKHEALRAIVLGNRMVYSEDYSPVGNIFDANISLTSAQYLRLYVLSALVAFSSVRSFQFLPGEEVRNALREIGFGDDITLRVLGDMSRHRFLFTASHTDPSFEAEFAPSRLGGYIVRDLIGNFTYVENVMYDTFIADNDLWNRLRELTDLVNNERDTIRRLQTRIERARLCYDYLEESYMPLVEASQRRGLSAEWQTQPLKEMRQRFRDNLSYAMRSAQRVVAKSNR